MCGLAGLFKTDAPVIPADVAAVQRMLDAQAHRGPDGEGMFAGAAVVLGHRRLSIIDLSDAGRQPMANEDDSVWVTYNGEIYNFRELREELRGCGHRFRSQTDTEVLVHGYEEWGMEGLLARLRGMFAFALYDQRQGTDRLFLARDRFGIKPLYYAQAGERLLFASEVRALLRSGLVPSETNLEALVRFLQLGSVPAPLTTVRGVLALPAGHYLAIDRRGIRLHRYWDLADVFERPTQAAEPQALDAIATTRALLDDAVERHLISAVPLGVFLSGGIDSSALVALASQHCDKPLTTLSIVFEEAEYSEASYTRLVAQRYRTDHCEVWLRSADFYADLPHIFAAMDQPSVDGVNTYYVSKSARQAGLTVVLSGIGGDEVFLGYPHLRRARALGSAQALLAALPRWARRGLLTVAMHAGGLHTGNGLERLSYLAEPSAENVYLRCRGLFTSRQIQDLLGLSEHDLAALGPTVPSVDGRQSRPMQEVMNQLEFQCYLQNQLLKDADFMSMAHALETRVPFLDHRLVEHVLGLHSTLKLNRRLNKPLLLQAVGDALPREVWDRPKQGFTFPFAHWLRQGAASRDAYQQEGEHVKQARVMETPGQFRGIPGKRAPTVVSKRLATMLLEQLEARHPL